MPIMDLSQREQAEISIGLKFLNINFEYTIYPTSGKNEHTIDVADTTI